MTLILVTGASGFIGTRLVGRLIARGDEVRCFVRNRDLATLPLSRLNVSILCGDIADKAAVFEASVGAKVVVHLAAVTSEVSSDLSLSRKTNVDGTRNVLEACLANKVERVITMSSESTKRAIRGPYAQTKLEADELVRQSGVNYTILRPAIVYGSGSAGLFQKTLHYIENLPFVPIIGSGTQKLSPMYLDDVIDAVIACIESKNTINKEYDLPGRDTVTFKQFIEEILQEKGLTKRTVHIPFPMVYAGAKLLSYVMKSPPVTTDNLLGLKQEVHMSSEKARQDFGFTPMTLKEGLNRTLYPQGQSGKVKVGVVGAGKMGLLHASIINQIHSAELVAVCDTNLKLKKQIESAGVRAPFFTDAKTMLDRMKLDAVFLCVPPFLNQPIARMFLDRGISVFVEKPLSKDLESARKMVSLADSKNVITACGYVYAYHPVFRKLNEIIRSEEYGRVRSFESYCYISQVLRKRNANSSWYYDPEKTGGGVLAIMASHLLFLLRMYFGPCHSAKAESISRFTSMDDEIRAELRFGKDIKGTLETSWSRHGYEDLTMGISLDLESARIAATNKGITVATKDVSKEIHISAMEDSCEFECGGKGYFPQDADFLRCVLDKNKPTTDWKQSVDVQTMIDAVYRSARSGNEVFIRDTGNRN